MMPLDRMPSVSVSIIVPAGAGYDRPHHWRTDLGELRASMPMRVGGYSYASIQGDPVALRELAAALVAAADLAEAADTPASALAEGVAR